MDTKRKFKINAEWNDELAYAIGLISADGNLSNDGRHIVFTSKDLENIINFRICLRIRSKIGRKARGGGLEKKYFLIQFSDVIFYRFLNSIGLTKNKSKTIQKVDVPFEFFSRFSSRMY